MTKKAPKSTKKAAPKKGAATSRSGNVASKKIDSRIGELRDWRGKTLERVRRIIKEADPRIVEEWKWVKPTNPGTPVWSHHGIICTGETYKDKVKLTFAKGASLKDPSGLFNSSLDGNVRRAIDIGENDKIDVAALTKLVRAAVALNLSTAEKKSTKTATKKIAKPAAKVGVKLLSGGNPQIAMAYGDAPVQDYIDAMPGWKRDVGRRLDAVIVLTVPNVYKAVKWNSPFYGIEGQGWFLSFHCFAKYIKVGFFRGTSLHPVPPGESKQQEVRYLDIHEDDQLDEAQFAAWVKQASQLPGERL